jgi:hypothetical protein
LDLTENGLDDLLAQSVAAASPVAFELEDLPWGAKREPGISRHHVSSSREAKDLP